MDFLEGVYLGLILLALVVAGGWTWFAVSDVLESRRRDVGRLPTAAELEIAAAKATLIATGELVTRPSTAGAREALKAIEDRVEAIEDALPAGEMHEFSSTVEATLTVRINYLEDEVNRLREAAKITGTKILRTGVSILGWLVVVGIAAASLINDLHSK